MIILYYNFCNTLYCSFLIIFCSLSFIWKSWKSAKPGLLKRNAFFFVLEWPCWWLEIKIHSLFNFIFSWRSFLQSRMKRRDSPYTSISHVTILEDVFILLKEFWYECSFSHLNGFEKKRLSVISPPQWVRQDDLTGK